MTTFATLTEHNGWEGETWRFYIPIEGNETALRQLQEALGETDKDDDEFHLDMTPLPEPEVDVLVKHSDSGYLADHTKLSGVLTFPPGVIDTIKQGIAEGESTAALYKGEIINYMKVAEPA